MYVWRYRTIPPNLSPLMMLKTSFWGQTAKFSDRQYFRLYGIRINKYGVVEFWSEGVSLPIRIIMCTSIEVVASKR